MANILLLLFSIQVSAGGVSGGGGNVIPQKPVIEHPTIPEIINFAGTAKVQVKSYLALKRSGLQQNKAKTPEDFLFLKLFSLSSDVFILLEKVTLDIEDHEPCFDSNGSAVDASIWNDSEYKVCMSAHSIASKISRTESSQQVSALLLHEYSEMAGLNESEAVNVQLTLLRDSIK